MSSKHKNNHTKRIIPCDHKLIKLFEKSIWIVPQKTLLAYKTINNVNTQVKNQTVWIIDRYENGYIFGTAYTLIDNTPISKTTFVGSITPFGDVLMAFYNNKNIITSGQGRFLKFDDEWKFLMQTNSLNNSISNDVVGISHWSYMIRISEDSKYNSLLGIDINIPKFIGLFKTCQQRSADSTVATEVTKAIETTEVTCAQVQQE